MISSIFHSRPQLSRLCCLLLFLLTLALYNPISHAPFLNFDDSSYVQNAHVRKGLNWRTFAWAFKTRDLSNWQPLAWLSHALDVQIFGQAPAGHHYVNVLLHALNAVLLFLLFEGITGATWRSFMLAALFAVHPINVESVAWISERKNVLSMLFFLIGLMAYVHYARKLSVWRYSLVFIAFALGLMTKPQVITFPFVLLLMDFWPLDRFPRSGSQALDEVQRFPSQTITWLLEKLPLLALSAASALITMKMQTDAIHLELPLRIRVENAVISYMKYLGKALWPRDLALLYPHPMFAINGLHAVIAGAVLIAITVLVLIARRHRYLPFGWFWFLGTLVPMIGLVQAGVQGMADRYAYIPFIGLFVAVCWGLADFAESRYLPDAVVAAASGLALVALFWVSHQQIGYWHDNVTLWSHTLAVTQKNFGAEDSLATALIAEGRTDEAAEHFRNALRINAADPIGNLNLAFYAQQHGNYDDAIRGYTLVLRLTSNPQVLAMALTNRGYAFYALKQYEVARQNFAAALVQVPEQARALVGLGLVSQKSQEMAQAAAYYRQAVELQPSDEGYLLLAQALDSMGQTEAARAARNQASRMSRDLDQAARSVKELLAN